MVLPIRCVLLSAGLIVFCLLSCLLKVALRFDEEPGPETPASSNAALLFLRHPEVGLYVPNLAPGIGEVFLGGAVVVHLVDFVLALGIF